MDLDLSTTDAEVVLGIASPVGTDVNAIDSIIQDRLKTLGYRVNSVRITKLISGLPHLKTKLRSSPPRARLESYMDAGNEARRAAKRGDFLAMCAINQIRSKRPAENPFQSRTAHVIRSLKHPDEVRTLRRVYGSGFFLIGIFGSEQSRLTFLTEDKGIGKQKAEKLIRRDASEENDFGQRTRDTFYLSDFFVYLHADDTRRKKEIWRCLELIFANPFVTMTPDEYAMYLAHAASLRSADLSRQVGAVIMSKDNDIIATGANDVPAAGGGLYWPGADDHRDHKMGYDSNARIRDEIIIDVMKRLHPEASATDEATLLAKGQQRLRGSELLGITEYGRAVHAEMEAILHCSRVGVTPKNGTLYSTTFPCHNCAKHIVGAGLERVVFIEPYPKSRAEELHSDSILIGPAKGSPKKVVFEPFFGIGPRRFFDLFSIRLGSGFPLRRAERGTKVEWKKRVHSLVFRCSQLRTLTERPSSRMT